MSRFGAALAADPDAAHAARRAAHGAFGRVAGAPDLVVVTAALADPDDAERVAAAVAEQAAAIGNERCVVVGTVAEGVMGETSLGGAAGAGRTQAGNAVAVWAARLPGTRVRPFRLHSHRVNRPLDAAQDGRPGRPGQQSQGAMAVAGLPDPWPDEQVALLFADPYSFPVDGFLARCNTALPTLPFVGGLAPGPAGYGSARLLLGGSAHATGAVGVLLGGRVQAAIAVSQGCRAIGPPMTVTAAEGDVLLGLAGRPAHRRLREILAEQPAQIRAQASTAGLHLGIALNEYAEQHESGDFLIRGVVGVLPEREGIQVGDHVEVGQTVRFQVRDAASADEQLRAVLRRARRQAGYSSIGGALLVSCHGRAAGLFPPPFGAGHDLHTVRSELGTGAVAGFFGTGEIGPVGGRNHLHGYTASVLAFADGE
jgi:small ligand-binding sensory domain FIST